MIELNKKQLSPHPASVIEAEKYYVVDYITKFFVGRALSVDGDNFMFKSLHPALGSKLTWPGWDGIEVKHISCVFYGPVQLEDFGSFTIPSSQEIDRLHKYLNMQ